MTVTGSGAVTAGESFTAPSGVPALALTRPGSATTQSRAQTQDVNGTPILFIGLTATSASTITGVPALSIQFIASPSSPIYLAAYNGTSWSAVAGPATITGGTTVSFGAVTFNPAISLAAGATLYLALYNGSGATIPNASPTPTGAAPTPTPTSAAPTPTPTSAAPTPTPTGPTPSPSPSPSPTPIPTPSPSPTPTLPPPGVLGVAPTTLTLNGTGPASFTVLETSYAGTYTVVSDTPGVVSIDTSPVTATGNSTTVNIHAVTAGTANITITDSNSQSVVLPVGVTTTPITIQGHRGGVR